MKSWVKWLIFTGFLLVWAFSIYFIMVISIAYFSGYSTVIFHFNLFGEMPWEVPLFLTILIISTIAFFTMFREWSRRRW